MSLSTILIFLWFTLVINKYNGTTYYVSMVTNIEHSESILKQRNYYLCEITCRVSKASSLIKIEVNIDKINSVFLSEETSDLKIAFSFDLISQAFVLIAIFFFVFTSF